MPELSRTSQTFGSVFLFAPKIYEHSNGLLSCSVDSPSPIYKPRDVETFTFAPVNYLGAFFILFYLKYGLTQCVIFGLEVLPPFSGAVNSADKL